MSPILYPRSSFTAVYMYYASLMFVILFIKICLCFVISCLETYWAASFAWGFRGRGKEVFRFIYSAP